MILPDLAVRLYSPYIGALTVDLCAQDGPHGTHILNADALTATDSLTVQWGRAEPWTTPEPATATVTVFDPAELLLAAMTTGSIHNAEMTITVPIPAGLDLPEAGGDLVLFRGHPAVCEVTEATRQTTRGLRTGHVVTITAADPRADLRNRRTSVAWPQESLTARAARVAALSPLSYTHQPTAAAGQTVHDMTEIGVSVDELMASLAETTGDHHQYNAQAHRVETIRLDTEVREATMLRLAGNTVTVAGSESAWSGIGTSVPGHIVARTSPDMTITPDTRVNTWTVTYGYDGDTSVTSRRSGYLAGDPIRSMGIRSWATTASWATALADALAYRGSGRWAGPHHPPLQVAADHAGGFDSWTQAAALLRTRETGQQIAVPGSPWTRLAYAAPVHCLIGGTITYARGRWRVLAHVRTAADIPSARLRWNQASVPGWGQSLHWGAPAEHLHFDHSVSWFDLRAVSNPTIQPLQE